jgi:galactokinase
MKYKEKSLIDEELNRRKKKALPNLAQEYKNYTKKIRQGRLEKQNKQLQKLESGRRQAKKIIKQAKRNLESEELIRKAQKIKNPLRYNVKLKKKGKKKDLAFEDLLKW